MLADIPAAGEADLTDNGTRTYRVADHSAGTCDALDRLGRQTGIDKYLSQFQSRKGRVAGGFDDDGIARSEGRADFVADEVERKVKRGDGSHYTAGNSQGKTKFARSGG